MEENINCPNCGCNAFHINRITENEYELKCWSQKNCTKKIRRFITENNALKDLIKIKTDDF